MRYMAGHAVTSILTDQSTGFPMTFPGPVVCPTVSWLTWFTYLLVSPVLAAGVVSLCLFFFFRIQRRPPGTEDVHVTELKSEVRHLRCRMLPALGGSARFVPRCGHERRQVHLEDPRQAHKRWNITCYGR